MNQYLFIRFNASDQELDVVDGDKLDHLIGEDDAERFRRYAVPGDFYDQHTTIVIKLGRRFAKDDPPTGGWSQ